MSLKNSTWVGTECDLGFSSGAGAGGASAGSRSRLRPPRQRLLLAGAADAATWRVGADTPPSNLGGATAGREAAASSRLDLPFGGSETCSALADPGGVRAGLSPKGFCRSHRVRTWTEWMDGGGFPRTQRGVLRLGQAD